MLNITMAVNGIEELKRSFATWGAEISDLSEPFQQIADGLETDNMLNMTGEGILYAGGWAPLASSTISEKARAGYGGQPILVRTGELAQSLAGGSGSVKQVTPTSLTVGTDDPIAKYHQYGTRKMPQRKIIGLSFAARSQVVRVLADYIRLLAAKAGLG